MQLFVEGDWSQFDIEPRRNVIVTFTSQKIRRTKTGFLFGHVKLSSASELSDQVWRSVGKTASESFLSSVV